MRDFLTGHWGEARATEHRHASKKREELAETSRMEGKPGETGRRCKHAHFSGRKIYPQGLVNNREKEGRKEGREGDKQETGGE